MKLIDVDNIDFVILEDSLHRIEHKKGDEIDCVIGANEVKAIPLERLEQIKQEVKEWYWSHDIQKLADDPCVVDAMTSMFIRMIDKALKEQNEV